MGNPAITGVVLVLKHWTKENIESRFKRKKKALTRGPGWRAAPPDVGGLLVTGW